MAAASLQCFPEPGLCHAANVPQRGNIPGVLPVVDGDAAALVENDIPWLGVNLAVALGEVRANAAHLFKPAVIVHVHHQRPLGQKLPPGRGGRVVLQGRRPDRAAWSAAGWPGPTAQAGMVRSRQSSRKLSHRFLYIIPPFFSAGRNTLRRPRTRTTRWNSPPQGLPGQCG